MAGEEKDMDLHPDDPLFRADPAPVIDPRDDVEKMIDRGTEAVREAQRKLPDLGSAASAYDPGGDPFTEAVQYELSHTWAEAAAAGAMNNPLAGHEGFPVHSDQDMTVEVIPGAMSESQYKHEQQRLKDNASIHPVDQKLNEDRMNAPGIGIKLQF